MVTRLVMVAIFGFGLGGCDGTPRQAAMSAEPIPLLIHPSACKAADVPGGPLYDGELWALGASTVPLRCPAQLHAGARIREWLVFLRRDQMGPTTTARLQRLEAVSLLHSNVGPAVVNDSTAPGNVTLHLPPCPSPPIPNTPQQEPCMPEELVNEDHAYSVLVTGGGGAGDRVGIVELVLVQ